MTDGYVSHQPESTGKKIETESLQVFDSTTSTWITVQRQRVDAPEPVEVKGDTLNALLVELKVLSYLLATGLNVNDDLESLRRDFYQTL